MADVRISVILNARNGAAFLRQALDSVIAQTFADWELVVWDDQSTDASADIVREYRDGRIRYFLSPEATSLGRARDAAIQQARGEWIAFLDQDDIWLPDKLERQLALVHDRPEVGLVYGRTVGFEPDGRERDFDHLHEFEPLPEGDIFERLFIESCFICMSSAMLRRSAVEPIPTEINVVPDYFLFLAVARRYRARAVQGVVCRYRWHGSNMSRSSMHAMHTETLWLIGQWEPSLSPGLVARRRRIHSTLVALSEIALPRSAPNGVVRLLRDGSLSYLASRPFARAARALKRKTQRPQWQRQTTLQNPPLGGPTDRDSPLTLSVIVVNWNVRELLRDCLESVLRQAQGRREHREVLVVDNDSADGSVDMVRREFPEARVFANDTNLGFAKANNQAFVVSKGKYVLLLNPDTIVLDHAIDKMIALMERRPDVGALGCCLENADGSFQRWTGGTPPGLLNVLCHFLLVYKILPAAVLPRPLYFESEPDRDLEVGWVSGACMLLRREAMAGQIFDERFFMYGEDIELCQRLGKAGWKVLYTPSAHVVHLEGRSLVGQAAEMEMRKLRSLRDIFAANHGRLSLLIYDLVVFAGFLLRVTVYGLAARARPSRRFEDRVARSRRFLGEAAHTLRRRKTPVGARS